MKHNRARMSLKRQVLSYLVVGGLSALIDIGGMQLLLMLGWAAWLAATVAYVAGVVFNYSAQSQLTFKSALSRQSLLRYLALLGINWAITLAFVLGAEALAFPPIWGKIASMPVIVVTSFFASKFWVYRK
jgi:putative flippase GtrA